MVWNRLGFRNLTLTRIHMVPLSEYGTTDVSEIDVDNRLGCDINGCLWKLKNTSIEAVGVKEVGKVVVGEYVTLGKQYVKEN